MKWRKQGKIFDPTTHPAFAGYAGFAQSPQAIELDDRVRVFFSIRKKDASNKFMSHVSFVDFSKDFKEQLAAAKDEVIELGKPGTFDEHGIFPLSPFRYNDTIYAYTCGWSRRKSVSVETSTGLAISRNDGLTFEKLGDGPIFGASLHEPFLVGDSFVRVFDALFHMWYIYGVRWIKPEGDGAAERVYKIAHAVSADGINWTRESKPIVSDVLGEEECQALPSVVKWGDKYHMIFCYRHAFDFRTVKEKGYRLGYAHSSDLVNWTREDEAKGIDTGSDWDSDMMCYPHLFACGGKLYLLYNGNEFGKFGFGLAVLEE